MYVQKWIISVLGLSPPPHILLPSCDKTAWTFWMLHVMARQTWPFSTKLCCITNIKIMFVRKFLAPLNSSNSWVLYRTLLSFQETLAGLSR
jgi:hypothetical protein